MTDQPYNAGGFIRAASVPTNFPERAAMDAIEKVLHDHLVHDPQQGARDVIDAMQKAGFSVVMHAPRHAPAADPQIAAIFDEPAGTSTPPVTQDKL